MTAMPRFLHQVLVTARQEMADTVRSRRAGVILILYVAGAVLICNGFISALFKLEGQLTETLRLARSNTPGTVLNALWKSPAFRRMLTELVGDRAVALELLTVPPIALIYGWLAFTFTPLLVMLTCSPSIAEELGTGSARFVLARTPRAAWCIGKFAGQAVETLLALTLSAVGAWCIARFRLAGADDAATIRALVAHAWKAWLYALAFVGLALGISQTVRQAYLAMGLGFGAWIALSVLGLLARHGAGAGWRQAWHVVALLVPAGHRLDLWRTDPAHVLPGAVFLVTLGAVYFGLGHAWFCRRDV